jgi:hypothetical protein
MTKLSLTTEIQGLYAPSARVVEIVDVPELKFLMIDGQIEEDKDFTNSENFQEALNTLNGVSFTLKFMSKLDRKNPVDYYTMPMEGLWHTKAKTSLRKRPAWKWTLMTMLPDHINNVMVSNAVESLRKKQGKIPTLDLVRLEAYDEGLAVQIMHVGSTALASLTLERLKDFANENGYKTHGVYHEIYISDPRHTKPEKERTIIRIPIKKK